MSGLLIVIFGLELTIRLVDTIGAATINQLVSLVIWPTTCIVLTISLALDSAELPTYRIIPSRITAPQGPGRLPQGPEGAEQHK